MPPTSVGRRSRVTLLTFLALHMVRKDWSILDAHHPGVSVPRFNLADRCRAPTLCPSATRALDTEQPPPRGRRGDRRERTACRAREGRAVPVPATAAARSVSGGTGPSRENRAWRRPPTTHPAGYYRPASAWSRPRWSTATQGSLSARGTGVLRQQHPCLERARDSGDEHSGGEEDERTGREEPRAGRGQGNLRHDRHALDDGDAEEELPPPRRLHPVRRGALRVTPQDTAIQTAQRSDNRHGGHFAIRSRLPAAIVVADGTRCRPSGATRVTAAPAAGTAAPAGAVPDAAAAPAACPAVAAPASGPASTPRTGSAPPRERAPCRVLRATSAARRTASASGGLAGAGGASRCG